MNDNSRNKQHLARFLPPNLLQKWSERNQTEERLARIWREAILDPDLKENLSPKSITKGILTVVSDVPVWISRARHMKGEILEQLRQHQEGKGLMGLHFRVQPSNFGSVPGSTVKTTRSKAKLSDKAIDVISQTAQDIKDEELRQAMERLGDPGNLGNSNKK